MSRSFWWTPLSCLLFAGPGLAAQHTLQAGFEQKIDYTDNVDLVQDNPTAAEEYSFTPSLELDSQGERWKSSIGLQTPFRRYSESRLDSDDQSFTAEGERSLLRGSIGFDAEVLRASTHAVDLDEVGLEGAARDAQRRVRDALSTHWTRKIGERNELTVGTQGQKVVYAPLAEKNFNDYVYYGLQVDWTHALNARTSTQLSAFGNRFQSEQEANFVCGDQGVLEARALGDRRSDSVGLQGGLTRVYSEHLRAQFQIGARNVDTSAPIWSNVYLPLVSPPFVGDPCISLTMPSLGETGDTQTGSLASAGITYSGERLDLSVTVSRALNPSGIGLLQLTGLTLEMSYDWRAHVQFVLHTAGYDNQSARSGGATDQNTFYSRKYYSIRPHVRWRFGRNWWLDSGVDVHNQDLVTMAGQPEPRTADRYHVFMNVEYRSQPISVFR
jgi:hypothetical protein